jgi:hypothetical protein
MLKRLLVGTVFAPSSNNKKWLELQMQFLKETTHDFDHAIVCNSVNPDMFKESIIVDVSNDMSHDRGLNKLIDYANANGYQRCLLLDSDCWPFKATWESDLVDVMDNHVIASAMRIENLDKFLHPCVVYLKREAMNSLRFSRKSGINLKGDKFEDVQGNATWFYPLVRTNAVNIHPLFCGIYWNAFYHHGAGTRQNITFRSGGYYRRIMPMVDHLASVGFDKLTENPKKFIDTLSRGHLELFTRKMFI